MVAYNRISQAEDKLVSQHLIHAKDYLECINHTNRLGSRDGSGLNHISLVQGLNDHYIKSRLPRMQKIGRPWQILSIPSQKWPELQEKQKRTMNPGMKDPLILMS